MLHGQVRMQRRALFQTSASGCRDRTVRPWHADAEGL
nr:MAG TPA: hypothetical protein [Herelleviridae sp.]DAN79925.1 MAG TPA: hypothetical protein [Bacteriophage sp.]DAV56478.1 MAG TPA: hypothetical protein [Bacteriophage sp.]DAW36806.1 MAG TPA: hypothetical protein [Caudoviricetes sp.]DAY87198.1 MAG TPA: hypothetical protein [Caudoviricetes sp.]